MLDPSVIRRAAQLVVPDDSVRQAVKAHILRRVNQESIRSLASSVRPDEVSRQSMKARVMRSVRGTGSSLLSNLASKHVLPNGRQALLRSRILAGIKVPVVDWSSIVIKWTAAFAVFLLLIRSLPLVFLAPVLQAQAGVQLIPSGEVNVTLAGIPARMSSARFLYGRATISTGDAQATVILSDDGVLRLGRNTVVRLHDIGDRPHFGGSTPTLTLVSGQLWVLGLVPTGFVPISVETSKGIVSVNAGSVSVSDDGNTVTLAVYDRGAGYLNGKYHTYLAVGDNISVRGSEAPVTDKFSTRQFTEPWVSVNLDMDAVHRREIADLQKQRREKMAGILPTSSFYIAKRFAEEVDVIFTLDKESRLEKRVRQADTRLSEALTLLKDGQDEEAAKPLTEYRASLVAMAGSGDNIARFLVERQIQEASSTIAVAVTDDLLDSTQETFLDLSTAIPDADQLRNIRGYILVDKLIKLNQTLQMSGGVSDALSAYRELEPEIEGLLSDGTAAHPLLKKEATALMVTFSVKVNELLQETSPVDADEMSLDLLAYLPPETETAKVLVSEAQLNAEVDAMVGRIFNLKMPRSRYNQLMHEMLQLRESRDPNRGTKLRRLYRKLPQNGLAGYVKTEIVNMGDELN